MSQRTCFLANVPTAYSLHVLKLLPPASPDSYKQQATQQATEKWMLVSLDISFPKPQLWFHYGRTSHHSVAGGESRPCLHVLISPWASRLLNHFFNFQRGRSSHLGVFELRWTDNPAKYLNACHTATWHHLKDEKGGIKFENYWPGKVGKSCWVYCKAPDQGANLVLASSGSGEDKKPCINHLRAGGGGRKVVWELNPWPFSGGGPPPPYNWYPIHNGENSMNSVGWPPNTP